MDAFSTSSLFVFFSDMAPSSSISDFIDGKENNKKETTADCWLRSRSARTPTHSRAYIPGTKKKKRLYLGIRGEKIKYRYY